MPVRGLTHESSRNETIEWYTPKFIFDALGIQFDLDPCSPLDGPVPWIPAKRFLTIRENGLIAPWRGKVWLNPPYGPETPKWLKRLALYGNGVALVFARTDTKWFHNFAIRAEFICFIGSRVRFIGSDGNQGGTPGCGSMLLGYGECAQAVRDCELGAIVYPFHKG